jgi:hypothetical protein
MPATRAKTAGQRLVAELSQPNDPYSVRLLIEQAAYQADVLDKLRKLTSGELAEWTTLKLGPQVVAVTIDNPIREARQVTTELRHLLAEIHRQRANIPMGDDDDDDVTRDL